MRWFWVGMVALAGCGGPSRGAQAVTVCPAGSMLDPQKNECVAMDRAQPVATVDAPVEKPRRAPQADGIAVDVTCAFPKGWVALVPASEYPKDDEFVMQALIGFTKEPSFWEGQADFASLKPYAAKECASASPTHLRASAPGDYYLLAGQEDTFALRGKYDKNGLRRKMSIAAQTSVSISPRDLTFTWDCISCPWLVVHDERTGRDLPPFVVLADRRGRARRGSDVHVVHGVPVVHGRITLRVVEIEREETHLESIALRVNGKTLAPAQPRLRLGPRTQSTLTFAVPDTSDGSVDVEIETTGYYERL